jgi:hypothetical protein
MKTIITISLFFVIVSAVVAGTSSKKSTFTVLGNCSMCKERIEDALAIDEVTSASWNAKTKLLTVVYAPDKISLDSLHQRIAAAGHDTERFKAPDAAYEELPPCCRYRK